MEKNKDILDYQSLRQKKQKESDESLNALYEWYKNDLMRTSNIREKVRAKHIFCEQTNISLEQLIETDWEDVFIDWFAFDYKNIQGSNMFQMFLQRQKEKLTEPLLILGAMFMATVYEPVIVKRLISNNEIEIRPFNQSNKELLRSSTGVFSKIQNKDIIFVRKVYSVHDQFLLGSPIKIKSHSAKDLISRMEDEFYKQKTMETDLTFRTFLKKNVLKYIREGYIISNDTKKD